MRAQSTGRSRSGFMDEPTSVPKYASPAAKSARTQLARNPYLRDWSNRDLLSAIQFWERGKNPVAFVTERLGRPPSHLDFEGADWAVWEDEDYILYVSPDGALLDLDTTASGLEPALKALRWDLGMSDDMLPRAEYKALFKQGRDEGLKYKYEIPSKPIDDLRQFVRDYCDGAIFCDHQVRDQSILEMVFMPLALGAFSISPREGEEPSPVYLAEQALVKDLGPEPERPEIPKPPVKPSYPPEPAPAEGWKTPDEEQIRIIKDDIAWNVSSPERLENYLEEIRLFNVGVDYHHADALATWVAAKKTIDRGHKRALAAHRRVLKSWDKRVEQFKAEHRTWALENARQEALLSGFRSGYLADLAVLYEYHSKAGPRAINGHPIFWSFRLMNQADWERARKAIIRELEHRESMEI